MQREGQSTTLIHLRREFTLFGRIEHNASLTPFRFSFPIENSSPVSVEVVPQENIVRAYQSKNVSESLVTFLEQPVVKGAERRNKMLHRPEAEKITAQEADEYVEAVQMD